jgi:hypothetical protein
MPLHPSENMVSEYMSKLGAIRGRIFLKKTFHKIDTGFVEPVMWIRRLLLRRLLFEHMKLPELPVPFDR